jgi:hypothetical protein
MWKKILSAIAVISSLMGILAWLESIAFKNDIKDTFNDKLDDDDIMD